MFVTKSGVDMFNDLKKFGMNEFYIIDCFLDIEDGIFVFQKKYVHKFLKSFK